jgi:hypothetical protein
LACVRAAHEYARELCEYSDQNGMWVRNMGKDVHRTLSLLRVTPAGDVSSEILYDVEFSGASHALVWRPDPRTTMPDGLGGMLATWDRCRDSLCGEFVRTATRFDADGNRADHVLATTFVGAPDLVMTSGQGTAWLSSSPTGYGYGTAVDVRTWTTQWTSSVYAMPVAPLDDGGVALQGMDGTLYTEGTDGVASPLMTLPVSSVFTTTTQLAFGEWAGRAWPGELDLNKQMLFIAASQTPIFEDGRAYSALRGGNVQGQGAQFLTFENAIAAALDALDMVYQLSVTKHKEWGGRICRDDDNGRFRWSVPREGKDATWEPEFLINECAPFGLTVAFYHTHPHGAPDYLQHPSGWREHEYAPKNRWSDLLWADRHTDVVWFIKSQDWYWMYWGPSSKDNIYFRSIHPGIKPPLPGSDWTHFPPIW